MCVRIHIHNLHDDVRVDNNLRDDVYDVPRVDNNTHDDVYDVPRVDNNTHDGVHGVYDYVYSYCPSITCSLPIDKIKETCSSIKE